MSHIKFSFIAGSNQEFMQKVHHLCNKHALTDNVRNTAKSNDMSVLEVQVKLVHMKQKEDDDHIIDIYA